MSDRFEAFKSSLSGLTQEFADRNRLAGAKAQETLDAAREDFAERMDYLGKVAVRLDQRYRRQHAPTEDRSFGFEGWPDEEDAANVADADPMTYAPTTRFYARQPDS